LSSFVLLLVGSVSLPEHEWAATLTVEMTDLQLSPQQLTINQADTVTWINRAGSQLDTSSYTGEWKSPVLQPGESFSHTFVEAKTYVYGTHYLSGSSLRYNAAGIITIL